MHEFLPKHLTGYIDGAFLPKRDLAEIGVVNPANGSELARIDGYGSEAAIAAIEAADRAMVEPLPLERRRQILVEIAAGLERHRERLATVITLENGKPLAEARGEVDYARGFYEEAARSLTALAPRVLDGRPRDLEWTVHARPAGVAALITPWNFPLAMLAKKLSSAIAGGCASVIKPAEITPLSCLAFFEILDEDTSMPKGFANLVFGDAQAIGMAMSEHPAVRVLSFTGSTRVGELLARQAAPHMKRLALELGGNAPFIVFDDALVENAVAGLMASKFRCAGQTCVCPNRVYVQEGIADAFTSALAEKVGALRVGDGMEPGTDIGPLINAAATEKVASLVDDAARKGARVLIGGNAAPTSTGTFYAPTVLAGVATGMRILREECFGPVVPIATFATEDAAIEYANDTEYGLASYVYTADADRADRVAARLRFGHVGINTGSGPTPEAPFGGMKSSGVGREGGEPGLLEFVEFQTVPRP